jgi:squalene-associated FAD-dependent desaturase
MGCCTNLLALLQRCQLDQWLTSHDRLTFVHPLTGPCRFAPSNFLPAPLHLAGVVRSLSFLNRAQRGQIRRGMLRLMRTKEDRLQGQLAGEWLRGHGQDDETVGEFWGTFVVSALGEEIDRVDMAAVRKVMIDGFASARGASTVLVPKIPLAELFGKRLPERLRELGIELRSGQAVTRLEHQNGTAVVHTGSGDRIEADHVIATVPWHTLGKLLPDEPAVADLTKVAEIPSSAITGVHLWFDQAITSLPHVVLVGTVAQWLFRPPWQLPSNDSTGVQKGEHYYQVVISASDKWKRLSKGSLVNTVIDDLRTAFPEAEKANLLHSRVVTDPHSVFSIRPESASLRPAASTALPWFHLAGDWIDTGWPATMEGAVISGRMAANSLARQQGWEGVEVDPGLPRGILARLLIRS